MYTAFGLSTVEGRRPCCPVGMSKILTSLALSLAVLCMSSAGYAQGSTGQLAAYYNFDAGDATESQGQVENNGFISGSPMAACGAVGGSLRFDGSADYVTISGTSPNTLLDQGDFVLSFYFHPTGVAPRQTLIRKKEDCVQLDRIFSIEYVPAENSIEVNFAENPSRFVGGPTQRIPLNPLRCWQHLIVERKDTELRICLNGERVRRFNGPTRFNIRNPGNLEIARASCPGSESNFAGFIDELRLYRGALTAEELETLYTPVDLIKPLAFPVVNIGTEVDLTIDNTCANRFTWRPAATIVAGADTPTPTVKPTESTTYFVELAYPQSGCRSTDSVLVQVFDPENFDCTQILVPAAFSPNGSGPEGNESLGISNASTIQEFTSFEIYDRWGNQVFTSGERFARWDGSYTGKEAMPGIYLWRVAFGCNGESIDRTGSVVLMR